MAEECERCRLVIRRTLMPQVQLFFLKGSFDLKSLSSVKKDLTGLPYADLKVTSAYYKTILLV